MDPAFIGQIVSAILGGLISGIGMHLYHTTGVPVAQPVPEPLPIPVPANPLPNHPLLSKALSELMTRAEEAAMKEIRASLSPPPAAPAAPPAAVTSEPTKS